MRPTLQTVADVVGVSRSTVSNAYSRPDQLSPRLRAQILTAARDLGYAGPDPAARSLRKKRVGAIGVLFSAGLSLAFADPYAVRFLRGLACAAERHDTGLLLIPLARDAEGAAGAVGKAVVDGFCIYCLPRGHAALAAVRARGLPTVATESYGGDGSGICHVGVDEVAAARAVGRHLTAFGHRRVAVIADWIAPEPEVRQVTFARPEDAPPSMSRERLIGYRDAFAESGIGWDEVVTVNAAENSREAGRDAAGCVLDRGPRPTAVVAVTDLLALGALDALEVRGLRPGADVSVVGFDDIPQAVDARLTTVRQSALGRGRVAGELLFDPPADVSARRVVLPSRLIVRASTGPATC
jgi:DNA-binding LacI/PurR family transcriptional regulator